MMIGAELVQQDVFYYIRIEVSSQPSYVDVEYDRSGDDDVVDLVTRRLDFSYSNGFVEIRMILMTNKAFVIKTDDDSKIFDHRSRVDGEKSADKKKSRNFEFEFEVGRTSGGQWWIDPHEHFVIDAMRLHVIDDEGDNIAVSGHGFSYQLFLTGSGSMDTRVHVDNVPMPASGKKLVFRLDGLVSILGDSELSGTAYGMWEEP